MPKAKDEKKKSSPLADEEVDTSKDVAADTDADEEASDSDFDEDLPPAKAAKPASKPATAKTGSTDNAVAKQHQSDAKKMQEHLASQPKVRMIIPLSPGEKPGAFETVNLNGFRMEIKKGVSVELPQQVAEVLSEYLQIDLNLANDYRLDLNPDKKAALE